MRAAHRRRAWRRPSADGGAGPRGAARGRGERLLHRRDSACGSPPSRSRRYARGARPALPRGLGPRAAHARRGGARDRARRRRQRRLRQRRRSARRRGCSSRLLVGLDPRRTEVVRELCETADFHGARPWTAEVAVWDLAARALGEPLWRLLGGRAERMLAYASTGELLAPDGARAAGRGPARRGRARGQAALRARRLARRRGGGRGGARRRRRGRRAAGRRQPRLAHGRRPPRARGTSPTAIAVRAGRSSRSASTGSRSRCRPPTSRATRACAPAPRCGSPRARWCAAPHEARDLVLRGGVDVIQPDAVLAGGLGGARRIAALAGLCGRMFSPHTWSDGLGLIANLHLALAVSTCPFVEVPFDPPGWSPERRDWLLGGPVVEIAADGTVAPPPGPGLGVVPDLDGAGGVPAGMRIRAAVLHAYGQPLEVCELELDPPRPRRGARARRRRRRLPLRPAPRRRPPRARARTRWCSATRARGSSSRWGRAWRTSRRAIAVAFCLVPACGRCRACAAGRRNLCETASAAAWAGTLLDGTSRLRFPGGAPVQHFNFLSCFADALRRAGRRRGADPARRCRCGRRRCSAAAS